MDPVSTALEYIVDDARFKTERPYAVHLGQHDRYAADDPKLNSIRWEEKPTIVHDMRSLKDVTLEKNGFQGLPCDFTPFSIGTATEKQVELYQSETEDFVKNALGAVKVICYDYRLRRNGPYHVPGTKVDINNPLLLDLPPRGAHNITFDSGPLIIKKVLEESKNIQFLDRKYRFRIVNTWRPLVEKLEDRPLAVCDFCTIQASDLIAADRIYVNLRTSLYYLKYNPNQRWYWFSHQTPKEALMMLMYDTKPKKATANFCPHVSFDNPTAPKDVPPRESVETRSVVISLASESG